MGFTPSIGDVAGGTTECSAVNCIRKCFSWHQAVVLAVLGLFILVAGAGFSLVAGQTLPHSVAGK